jgi:hypothetical protein
LDQNGDDEELGLDGPSDDLEDIENSEEVGPEMGLDTEWTQKWGWTQVSLVETKWI